MTTTRMWKNAITPALAGCLLAGWLAALPAAAQGEGGEEISTTLRLEEGVLRLTLDEAIGIALERNLSLVVERYRRSESEVALDGSQGIYDVNTRVDLSSFEETSPAASNLAGAPISESEGSSWNLGVSRLVPSGGVVSADWNNDRLETNSLFALLNPSFTVDLDVSYVQPLLRNAGRGVTESGIRVARNNVELSQEEFERQVIEVIEAVEDAYWSLVEAQAQLGVSQESLALARQLHDQNKVRVEVGTLAPLELVTSEAGIATRQEEIIRAQALVGDTEDLLRQLLNLNRAEVWAAEIVPETDPEMTPVELDVEAAVVTALERRRDLRGSRLLQQNREIDAVVRANQARPQLDFAVTYGFNGLGGDITERDFFTREILFEAPGDYGDALDQITGGDFDGWSASLNFSYDLGNRDRRAQRTLAELAVERGEAELRDQELAVITQVRRLARLVDAAAQARESARVSRRLAEKNLDAEQKRFENGMSTSFQVLLVQEDLTEAQSREVNTITGYRKALSQYYRAIGMLIEQSGVELVGGSV